ncbi:MAG TPA: hypothetical protein VM221_13200 [Armatimonadota bacterium]|nr:hypothetical protein [Armatimonadota bacterium]
MRGCLCAGFSVVLMLALTGGAHALQLRSGDTIVVEKGVTIDDDLVVAGQDVRIEGTVNGNLVVAAQTLSIPGEVGGSVVAIGQKVSCSGPVGGSFQGAGQMVTLDSSVRHNFIAAGQRVVLGDNAVVRRDALAACKSLATSGVIGGNLKAAGGTATVAGGVGDNAYLWVERLRLAEGAKIMGNLVYESARPAIVATGAKVMGDVVHRLPRPRLRTPRQPASPWIWRSITLVWLVLFTLGLTALLPRHMHHAADRIRSSPLWSLLVGFLAIVIGPLVVLVLLGPVLPAALIVAGIWVAFLYTAKAVFGVFLGSWLFRGFAGREVVRPVIAGLVGVVILWALMLAPYFGFILRMAVTLLGFGAITMFVGSRIAAGYRRDDQSRAAGSGT